LHLLLYFMCMWCSYFSIDSLFRRSAISKFTTVLGFGLWLGLVGIVDIRNSGPKSLFHACFVCTLIFCFCFQIFMLNLKLNRNIYGDMIFCHSAFVLLHYLTACMLYSFNHSMMRKPDKSALGRHISQDAHVDKPALLQTSYVLDGGALLHHVRWLKNATYSHIIEQYVSYVERHYGSCVSLVFDG